MANSIEYLCEQALLNVVSSVAGINYYTSDRVGTKTHPFVDIKSDSTKEILTPASGVFMVGVQLRYCAKLDDTTAVGATSVWQALRQTLYDDAGRLETRLTGAITGFTCYGVTTDEGGSDVRRDDRVWEKSLTLMMRAMPRTNP